MPKRQTGKQKINALKLTRPDVCIKVSRTIDRNFRWDGDGRDPVERGMDAYDIDVTAMTIRNGKIVEGHASLGGTYMYPQDKIGEISGYLPQMVDEAVEELDANLRR